MQLQPQTLDQQSHFTLYQQQQLATSASGGGVYVGGGQLGPGGQLGAGPGGHLGPVGQIGPLAAHRDPVMPGKILWPSFC